MAPSHASFLRPAGAGANGVGRLKGSHQRSLGMESPNALRWRFEAGSRCTFTAAKATRPVLPADDLHRRRALRERGPGARRAVGGREFAGGVKFHPRAGALLRAVPSIEIEHLVVLAADVLAISPESEQDIGLLAAQMIFEEFGR